MEFDDVGSGDALVLIHGHPFNRSMWRPQAERFSESGWRVVAPDLRGYGGSAVVPGKTTLDVFAADVAALLDHLGIDEVVIAGLSMGGQIAMEFFRLFPERVRGLVIADSSPRTDSAEGRRLRLDTAERVIREGMADYAEETLPRMIAPYNIAELPDVARHVLEMMRTTSAEGAAAALRGRAERPDYVDVLRQVTVPSLVVVGRDDYYTPVADALFTRSLIPNAALAVIENAGHMPNLERQTEFNEALQQLLETVSADSPSRR
ncbi:alpha/beta fold hydrolase [Nonomuraea sp. CA-141351]|uniref:alpha/beta fold hydrolase n=1 Tax=Nonomuraea sp. CA-141351 TaxID=3239996 RepID=UPI003D8C4E26